MKELLQEVWVSLVVVTSPAWIAAVVFAVCWAISEASGHTGCGPGASKRTWRPRRPTTRTSWTARSPITERICRRSTAAMTGAVRLPRPSAPTIGRGGLIARATKGRSGERVKCCTGMSGFPPRSKTKTAR